MKKFLKDLLSKRLNNEKGLTLIELLAVIVILAIVAAIAIPAIGNIIDNSRFNAVKADAINAINAANLYYTENSTADPVASPVTVQTLVSSGFLESKGKLTNSMTIGKTANNQPLSLDGSTLAYSGSLGLIFTDATADTINSATRQDAEATGATGAVVAGTPGTD